MKTVTAVAAGNGASPKETACRNLDAREVDALRAACDAGASVDPIRDRALVEIMACEGFRVRGACSLTVGSARGALATGTLNLRASANKGGRRGHSVPLRPEAREALCALVARHDAHGTGQAREPLFRSRKKGGFLQPAQAYRIVRALFAAAGLVGLDVPGLLGCHSLRKSFAQNTLRAAERIATETGASPSMALVVVQRALGHQNLDTTKAYLALDGAAVNAAVMGW